MYIYIYIYIYNVCIFACMHARTYVCMYVCSPECIYIHTQIQASTHESWPIPWHTYIHTHTYTGFNTRVMADPMAYIHTHTYRLQHTSYGRFHSSFSSDCLLPPCPGVCICMCVYIYFLVMFRSCAGVYVCMYACSHVQVCMYVCVFLFFLFGLFAAIMSRCVYMHVCEFLLSCHMQGMYVCIHLFCNCAGVHACMHSSDEYACMQLCSSPNVFYQVCIYACMCEFLLSCHVQVFVYAYIRPSRANCLLHHVQVYVCIYVFLYPRSCHVLTTESFFR
jgi:hypothetical protein